MGCFRQDEQEKSASAVNQWQEGRESLHRSAEDTSLYLLDDFSGHYCFSGGLISRAAVNQSAVSPLTWSWDKGSAEMTPGSHAQVNIP